jgi:hypothetical protein
MRVLAVALVVIAAAGVAHAQDVPPSAIVHRVRQGDTLELIAAELYGDRTKAVLIMVENKLPHARPLRPGERLRIPTSREVATAPGDTFESLAGAYLGSTRRAPFLADFNGIPVDDSVAAGTLITIPLTVVHTAANIESIIEISKLYFGDAKQAELLRRYNFLDKRSLDKNEMLIVPAYHVRLAPAKQPPLDTESKARRDHRREASAKVARALPAARQAWKNGDYGAVRTTLGELASDLDYLDTGDAVDAGVLLGAAQVAYDDGDAALATFKHVLDRNSHHVLRRYDCSPKLVAAWQRAGGQVE